MHHSSPHLIYSEPHGAELPPDVKFQMIPAYLLQAIYGQRNYSLVFFTHSEYF